MSQMYLGADNKFVCVKPLECKESKNYFVPINFFKK